MQIALTKIKSINGGCLYKIYSNGSNLEITLLNTKTIFGIENQYNSKTIKWVIQQSDVEKLKIIENLLALEFKETHIDEIKSKIINKPNYPIMVLTKINNNKSSNDIINHEPGEITSFTDLNKKYLYDVKLKLSNVFLKKQKNITILHYTIETNLINKK